MAELITAVAELVALLVQLIFWALYGALYTVLRLCGMGHRLSAPRERPRRSKEAGESTHAAPQIAAITLTVLVFGGGIAATTMYQGVQKKRETRANQATPATPALDGAAPKAAP